MRQVVFLVVGLAGALQAGAQTLNVLVDDNWATGTRAVQQLPERSAWWSTSAERLTAQAGSMTGVLEGSSRMWVTHFTDASAVELADGEVLRVTVEFTPGTVNGGNTSRGFRVGLFNYETANRLVDDGFSSGGGNGAGVTGYLLNMNFAPEWGMDNPMELRRRVAVEDNNLMGALAAFGDPLGSGGGSSGGPGFVSDRRYKLVMEAERTGAGLRLGVAFSDGLGWESVVSAEDPAPLTAFDTFALRPDRDERTAAVFTFHQFKVEYLGEGSPVDPPTESIWKDLPADALGNRSTPIGLVWDAAWPWVYHHGARQWLYIFPGALDEAIDGYAAGFDGFHFRASAQTGDWLFIYDLQEWARWSELPAGELLGRDSIPLTPHDRIPEGDRVLFVATDGSASGTGAEAQPFAALAQAVAVSQPGDVIVLRGGVYHHASTISIGTSRNATAAKPITVINHPGEQPVFDFSNQPRGSGNIGIRLDARYWRMVGLTVRNAGHNGIRMDGSHNRLERIVAHNNHDTGIHMAGSASHNLILNCDSYHNFNTTGRVGNSADGFGAKFEGLGPGNHFYGCRSWENSDDGFDFWMAPNPVRVENCWAFGNGDASVFGYPAGFDGGGNGFKLGGNSVAGDHVVIRCMAFDNFGYRNNSVSNAKGFDHNNNTGALTLIHNTAYNNGRNFVFPNAPQGGGQHAFYNNLSALFTGTVDLSAASVQQGNSWQAAIAVTASLFASLDTSLAKSPRQPDGSLPAIDLLRPLPGSFLVDGGVDLGPSWPFNGAAPDVGAVETP